MVARGADSPYVNWFYVEDLPVVVDPERFDYATCGGAYYLPKWNVHNPEVRAHLFDVTRRWTAEGIDGWRLDVPYFMNQHFWRRFRELAKGIDDDLYIVAEYWQVATDWVRGDTADGAMNYPLRDLILGLVADRKLTPAQFADGVRDLWTALPPAAVPGMLNLLGSHDTERLLTRCGGDTRRVRKAQALPITSPGVPMLYYGDEVGMAGQNDPGCRGCMPWDPQAWNNSILETTRELLTLRRAQPELLSGADEIVHASDGLLVRRRGTGPASVIVAVNVSDQARPLPPLKPGLQVLFGDGAGTAPAALDGGGVLILGRRT
ncbi:alpha-amylase family glycosyl hydrolase [Dactylosporangium sp. NPDC048998]|uniref:alpha-amylase family glycosyl hydrolase n=1 Tax=Dactylosporangium sp. NPDC048998 TaxID=3363976 RepID=UPI0037200F69